MRSPSLPQHSFTVQPSCEADDLLAEAIAHEEYRVLCDVGHQCWCGALVETTQAHLFVGGHDAVKETTVELGEGLHLDLSCVQWLPTKDTCSSPLEEEGEKTSDPYTDMVKNHSLWLIYKLQKNQRLSICGVKKDKNHIGHSSGLRSVEQSMKTQREINRKKAGVIKKFGYSSHS